MITSLSPKAKQIIGIFACLSGVAIAIVVGSYFFTFAPQSNYRLSGITQDWGLFGDYLAGTLGTVFSLLAFLGVLCTVWLQAKQLDLAKTQASLDEIQRVMANVAGRIDGLISEPVSYKFNSPHLRSVPATFFSILSSGGTAVLSLPSPDWMRQAQLEQWIAECKAALATQSSVIGIELDQFAWLLEEYRQQGGASQVLDFYKRRYTAVICWLDALGFVGSHAHVQREFTPESMRVVLTQQPG